VLVTALSPLAKTVGANRIVRGKAVSYPFGDPTLSPIDERRFRRRLVEKALSALAIDVDTPTVFEADPETT